VGGSLIFCQKEYSETFPELLWGKMIYYNMRCLLTIKVSQILSLTSLISEIKVFYANIFFTSLDKRVSRVQPTQVPYYDFDQGI
jgi:hypothetical protein